MTPKQARELLLTGKPPSITRVEVARSYSYKLNVGNYESRDFFCSQKAECDIDEAQAVGRALYEFCRAQVMEAVDRELEIQAFRNATIEKQRKAGYL